MRLPNQLFMAGSTLAMVLSPAAFAGATLVNPGFETGDLSGWETIGEVNAVAESMITTDNGTVYTISPKETTMAFLDSFGATVPEVEAFLGIASGSLFAAQDTGPTVNDGGNFQLTNGSAIKQSFFAEAGDTVDMSWNYVARDYIPYTDPSFGVLVAPDGTAIIDVLASTTGPGLPTGSDGISGVFSFAELLTQTGEYTIGFAVANSGDEILDAALFIDNEPGDCNPACNPPGSPENPLLPDNPNPPPGQDGGPGGFDFTFEVTEPTQPIFIDPEIAVGYTYVVESGPNVASVIFPDIGDGLYDVFGWDGSAYSIDLGDAFAGIAFDFGAAGVSQFQVMGIETSAMLDPADPTAFVTGLTFVEVGQVAITQTPVVIDVQVVPGPAVPALLSIGFLSLAYSRRCLRRKERLQLSYAA